MAQIARLSGGKMELGPDHSQQSVIKNGGKLHGGRGLEGRAELTHRTKVTRRSFFFPEPPAARGCIMVPATSCISSTALSSNILQAFICRMVDCIQPRASASPPVLSQGVNVSPTLVPPPDIWPDLVWASQGRDGKRFVLKRCVDGVVGSVNRRHHTAEVKSERLECWRQQTRCRAQ